MFGLGIWEMIAIIFAIFLLFGASFAKRITSTIIDSIKEFKTIRKEIEK